MATLRAYSTLLKQRDFNAAYELLSDEYRQAHSREDFVRMMETSGEDVAETAARLDDSPRALQVTARLQYGWGDELDMVQEDGQWKLSSNPIVFYNQNSPREALKSFLRAYELKRWDVMLKFVPKKFREKMTVETMRKQFEGPQREQVTTMMSALEAHVDAPISDTRGGQAKMPFGDQYEVEFLREEGRWLILDLD